MEATEWRFIKQRTADSDGAVYVSPDGQRYRRTGGESLRAEAAFQRQLAGLGYPVPRLLEEGLTEDGHVFVVEQSLGEQTLHDLAVASLDGGSALADEVVDLAAQVSARLLLAQAAHPVAPAPDLLREWVEQAGFTANVFKENPDLDTARTHAALGRALDQLESVPLCRGHLDYGLPNVLPAGVIDWQHHGVVPLGYDVLPTLEVVPFKGGNKGYTATAAQRRRFLSVLDEASESVTGQRVSQHLGAYLLVKALFFLALMRPTDPARADKHLKWMYRRDLFAKGLEQYERTGAVDTSLFPTLDDFAARHRAGDHS
ncbi:phosphotransferase [Streptomyces sp. NPDC018059]|uniref:phosphotransferase n=1 Tax=Streptomyces sp. NPDC018059 TaxID=3365041 RepID=UPI0037BD66D2